MYLCKVKSKLNIKTVTSMRKIFTSVLVLFPLLAWGQTVGYNWNETTKTLQLGGVDRTRNKSITLPDGATIVLSGENLLDFSAIDSCGFYCEGDLTIQGTGSLKITSNDDAISATGNVTIKDCELSIQTIDAEGIQIDGNLTISNAKVGLDTPEESLYPGGTLTIENNSVVTITSDKDGIDSASDVYISDSEVTITSKSDACINGNVTAKNSTLVLNALGDNNQYDACFDASYGETYSFENCELTLVASNGGSIFSPKYESMMTKAAQLNFPEGVTMENTLCRVEEASSNSYYTAVIGAYTLDENLDITDNLIITEGSTLTIPKGITLTNSGTLANAGMIVIQQGGVMEGEENGEIIRDSATGIEDIEGAKVYAQEGTVYVQTPSRMKVAIVSISGATVARAEQEGLQSYSLPKGIYIICIGEQTFKVRN